VSDVVQAPPPPAAATPARRWTLEKLSAYSIIVFVVLTVGVVDQLHGKPPTPSDTPVDMANYFVDKANELLAAFFILNVSAFFLLFYYGVLWKVLKRAEGESAWLSALALSGGIIAIATAMIANGIFASAGRTAKDYTITPDIALAYFHMGFVFFMGWIGFAFTELAVALLIFRTGIFPRWMAWFAIGVIGLWFLASWPAPRNASTLEQILFDYSGPVSAYLTYIWMIILGVLMARRGYADAPQRQLV
jgi:hypothetical protein